MNILVTGGLGHIGSHLIREYAKRDDVQLIRIFDNISTQRYISLFDLPQKEKIKLEFIEGDITNSDSVEKAMRDIDVVVHLAAITDGGTWNVLWAAINHKVKRFLYASTTSVYGEAEGIVDENASEEVYKPASPYALAKRKTEKLLQEISKETKFPIIVLRKGTIFGTSIGMRFHTAINKFCYLAAMNKPLTVWDSALDSKRPYLGLNDCVRAYEFLEKNGKSGEVYNIVTKNFEMKEIVETIKQLVPNLKVTITNSPILNQKPYHVSNQKIIDLGFEFHDNLSDNIKETI